MSGVTRKAKFDVWYEGVLLDSHITRDECYETIIKHREQDTEKAAGAYEIRIGPTILYEIDMGLIGRTATPVTVDQEPTVVSTPSPSFTVGTSATYDMSQHFSDDGLSAVTYGISATLGAGLTFNTST